MVKITDLFSKEQMQEKGDGNFVVECPSCGSNNNGYGGMVLFVETDTAYCFESKTWFKLKEVFALQKGIISCTEGRIKE